MVVFSGFYSLRSLHVQVSIRGDCEDRDLLEQGNGSTNSSMTLALDFRLVLIIHFQFATRNLHGSVD